MALKLIHTHNDNIQLYYDGVQLFTYVYQPQVAAVEAPRPYFHPMRTLAGDVVTNFRPNDHRWHHGLSMTFAYLSGDNFWGGNSYVRDQGYTLLDNLGQQQHREWEAITCEPDHAYFRHQIAWVSSKDEIWIDESRTHEVTFADDYWVLTMRLALHNVRGQALEFGSPATEGRPGVSYGGLFWRGARDLTGGTITIADGPQTNDDDMAVMGQSGSWLSFVGLHDVVDHHSTVLLIDHPDNPRYPNPWFARTTSNVGASFAFIFDEIYTLEADAVLNLNYQIVFANGAWDREQCAQFAAAQLANP